MKQQLNTKLKAVAEFAKKTGLPIDIYMKMKKFVENNFFNLMSDDEEGKLLIELSPSLRNEVFKVVHGKIIE